MVSIAPNSRFKTVTEVLTPTAHTPQTQLPLAKLPHSKAFPQASGQGVTPETKKQRGENEKKNKTTTKQQKNTPKDKKKRISQNFVL